jgi:Mg2+/Co2+ transporter CorB
VAAAVPVPLRVAVREPVAAAEPLAVPVAAAFAGGAWGFALGAGSVALLQHVARPAVMRRIFRRSVDVQRALLAAHAIDAVVGGVLRLIGLRAGEHGSVLTPQEELRSAVDLLHKEGSVERSHRDMFGGLLGLNELTVEDVMVHRTRMRTIDAGLPPAEIVRAVLASANTRLPLWRDQPENIVGVLHAKDLLRALAAANGDANKLNIDEVAIEPWFVPATSTLEDQLQSFLSRKTHFALVVDEYGSVMGLVTLEDILEEIVGDIRDEHDLAVQGLRALPDGSVTVDGAVPIRDLNRAMDWSLPDEEATTVAGLVIHEAQTIPEPGQVFSFHNFRFEILRKQRNRLTALKITPMPMDDGSG